MILYAGLVLVILILILINYGTRRFVDNAEKDLPKDTQETTSLLQRDSFALSNNNTDYSPITVSENLEEIIDNSIFPKSRFSAWRGLTAISTPATRTRYILKDNFSNEEIRTIARVLATHSEVKTYGPTVFSRSIGEEGQLASILLFNARNGYFQYTAMPGVVLPEGTDTPSRIYALLKKLNMYDPTLQITAQYRRASAQDTAFYEVRRSWGTAGLPVLNPLGLLGLRDGESMQNASFRAKSSVQDRDEDIYQTSDNTDGLTRKSDFNTMTIAVSTTENRVTSIMSNLRIVSAVREITPIIGYAEAAAELRKGNGLILNTPSGNGANSAWNSIYPNNSAVAEFADVTEQGLFYLELPPGFPQSFLEPMYVFRGTAELKSGYRTDFIATVPATHPPGKTSLNERIRSAFFAYANDTTQKQADFKLLTPTPLPNPPTPTPDFTATCVPAAAELNPFAELRSTNINVTENVTFGYSHTAVINGEVVTSSKGWWYMVPAPSSDLTVFKKDFEKTLLAIRTMMGNRDYRAFLNALGQGAYPDFQQTGVACPIRITGESPTIFVYGPAGAGLKIQPISTLAYVDPITNEEGSWDVELDLDGKVKTADGLRPYLYYEFLPSTIPNKPTEGFSVSKNMLGEFARKTLGPTLGLLPTETARLAFELTHAAADVDSDQLFIGLIEDNFINHSLPLRTTPEIRVIRYHWYVGADDNKKTPRPTLSPVQRSELMILEIGAWSPEPKTKD